MLKFKKRSMSGCNERNKGSKENYKQQECVTKMVKLQNMIVKEMKILSMRLLCLDTREKEKGMDESKVCRVKWIFFRVQPNHLINF